MDPRVTVGALPKLVALDLDGTLLTSDKRITPRAQAAVRALARRGVHVVLCTGRPPRSAVGYAAELGLGHPFICYNGAALFDPERAAVQVRHHLDPVVARAALARLRGAFPDVMAGLEADHGWYLEPAIAARRESEARLGDDAPTGVGPIESFLDGGAIKLFVRHDRVGAEALAATVEGLPVYRTWSSPTMLELMSPEVDKRGALAELCATLGIERRQVAAFGDQRNDEEMIAWAGTGVAVANASAPVREVADLVAGANDADGVAEVLESWLKGSPHQAPTSGL